MARVNSWDWMTSGGLWPLGLVLGGPAAQLMGIGAALWLSAALGIALSLWVLFVKDVRRLRGSPARASAITPNHFTGQRPTTGGVLASKPPTVA